MEFKKLQIEGMTCTNCANGVKKSLEYEGFSGVQVDFTTGLASFELPDDLELGKAVSAVERLGYQVLDGRSGADGQKKKS